MPACEFSQNCQCFKCTRTRARVQKRKERESRKSEIEANLWNRRNEVMEYAKEFGITATMELFRGEPEYHDACNYLAKKYTEMRAVRLMIESLDLGDKLPAEVTVAQIGMVQGMMKRTLMSK